MTSRHKRVLIQPAAAEIPTLNFNKTVSKRVPLSLIEKHVTGDFFQRLEVLDQPDIATWGFVPSKTGKVRKEWNDLEEGDYVLFYGDKHFFHRATVHAKIHCLSLAKELWSADENGSYFEYVYFLRDDAKLIAPYKRQVIDYDKDYIQGAVLLDNEKSEKLINYINGFDSFVIDADRIEPSDKEKKSFVREIEKIPTDVDINALLKRYEDQYKDYTAAEKVKKSKLLVRNKRIANEVKIRDNYICQVCGAPPFIKENGVPYAEAHHKFELSRFPIDHPDFMYTVCPTCHRVLHFGSKQALLERQALKKN